ncbi:hypothetical protein [Streptosporangium sp. NPDC002721]|uniref:hypothetical protein n=1 Tax=Streptosporangium sp. NPDC002721 TaxID=3366188 RepID=UPI0036750B20
MIPLLARLRRQPAPEPVDPLVEAEHAEAAALAARADSERCKILAAAAVAQAEADAKIAAITHRARLHTDERQRAAEAKRIRDAEAARVAKVAAQRSKRRESGNHTRTLIAEYSGRARRLIVNLIVNGAAGFGQARFFIEQQELPVLAAVMLAAGLELVAVTVLDYGLAARRQGRPYRLQFIAAALLAGVVAGLNYGHWSATQGQQALAIPFAILSLLSPVLWAWYAAARYAETASMLEVDGRAPSAATQQHAGGKPVASFDALQWLLWLPETFAAKRQAVRYKIADAESAYRVAVEHLTDKQRRRDAKTAAKRAEALDRKQQQELPSGAPNPGRYLPTRDEVAAMASDHEKRESAEDAYRQARLDGVTIPGSLLGTHYGMSESWGRARTQKVRAVMRGQLDDSESDETEGQAQ